MAMMYIWKKKLLALSNWRGKSDILKLYSQVMVRVVLRLTTFLGAPFAESTCDDNQEYEPRKQSFQFIGPT